jgi:hypothetical protein
MSCFPGGKRLETMRALAPLKDVLGWLLTGALGWLAVVVIEALVDQELARFALTVPCVCLVPFAVSKALGLRWFEDLANWRQRGG